MTTVTTLKVSQAGMQEMQGPPPDLRAAIVPPFVFRELPEAQAAGPTRMGISQIFAVSKPGLLKNIHEQPWIAQQNLTPNSPACRPLHQILSRHTLH